MNPIQPNSNSSNQKLQSSSSNSQNAVSSQRGAQSPIGKGNNTEDIRLGLVNARAMIQDPEQRMMHFLGFLSQKPSKNVNIHYIVNLLGEIKDKKPSVNITDIIVNHIIHNDSLSFGLRLQLAEAIVAHQTDAADAKAIILETIQHPDQNNNGVISLELIKKAPENQKPELYEAFVLNSKIHLNVRAAQLDHLPNVSEKDSICERFAKDLESFAKMHTHDESEELDYVIRDLRGNLMDVETPNFWDLRDKLIKIQWIQKPAIQEAIRHGIDYELNYADKHIADNNEVNTVISRVFIAHLASEEYKKWAITQMASILERFTSIEFLEENIDYKDLLIKEEAIQEALFRIGMRQCTDLDEPLAFRFEAFHHIESTEKRMQILNNMFTQDVQMTFGNLKDLYYLLESKLEILNQEECVRMLSILSKDTCINTVRQSYQELNYYQQNKWIQGILKLLYTKIDDPTIFLKILREAVFDDTETSVIGLEPNPMYAAHLENKNLTDFEEFERAFYEIFDNIKTKEDFGKQIGTFFNQDRDSIKEKRIRKYYQCIIEKCHESLGIPVNGQNVVSYCIQFLSAVKLPFSLRNGLKEYCNSLIRESFSKVL